MKKSEIIEKYGEAYYEEKLKKQKEYYKTHKEERIAYNKINKEKHNESNLKSYYKHIDDRKLGQQLYRESHKEDKKLYNQNYYKEHKEEMNAYSREYHSTPIGRAKNLIGKYKATDKKHNRGECTLTDDYIVNILFPQGCFWCGETDFTKLGADRIDNTKPHTPDNVVCSCLDCNNERMHLPFEEFVKKKKMAS